MNNLIKILVVLFTAISIQSCDTVVKEKTSSTGLKYTVLAKGEGEVSADSMFLVMNMRYVDNNDSVWYDTDSTGVQAVVQKNDSIWSSSEGSIEGIFNELGKGDSVKFGISAEKLFSKTFKSPLPPTVDKATMLTFYISVEDVYDQEGIMAWQQEMIKKQQAKAEEDAKGQLEEDIVLIDEYLAENNIEAMKTESGLRYVITAEGEGENAKQGDQVFVNYSGKVLGGAYFDTSNKELAQEQGLYNEMREPYAPFDFKLGTGSVIKGWDEGIALLNKGGKATLYIPSTLAYGPRQRSEVILANSILEFDVELVDIKNESE